MRHIVFRSQSVARVLLLALPVWVGCGSTVEEPDEARLGESAEGLCDDPGALVKVTMDSTVGVVLDEIPSSIRNAAASYYLGQASSFWKDRAKFQIRHTNYRLTYRDFFYGGNAKKMMALPPESTWTITLENVHRTTTADGHDAVLVDYSLSTTLLTDPDSPEDAEPKLKNVGGVWNEPFNLPLDPEFLFQRTGFACMDEDGYPLNTAESENAYQLFDQTCEVETPEEASCHLTGMPNESCVDALAAHSGRVDTNLKFKRLAWDDGLADDVRVGTFTHNNAPDLAVVADGLEKNWITYRYIAPDSCSIVENCVSGPGWRRLLEFDASIKNTGAKNLTVGSTADGSPLRNHNVFEFSACHQHFHFTHYGDFSYGATPGDKRAFCIESTDRYYNNEQTPLTHPYSCEDQGVAAGWGDTYIAGVECNWIDLTDVNIPNAGTTKSLKFVLNPDDFICEGDPILNANGKLKFEPTEFETENGEPVDRPMCDFTSNYKVNNIGTRNVQVPKEGSIVTSSCSRNQAGPLRDCGFTERAENLSCTPGQNVHLSCKTASGQPKQVLRVCENSAGLGGGVACMYREAAANKVIGDTPTNVNFTCPAPRDVTEPGGGYALYGAPVLPTDPQKTITCTVVP